MSASGRTVLFVLGVMLASLSAAMFAPAIADLHDDAQAAHAFFGAGGLGLALELLSIIDGR